MKEPFPWVEPTPKQLRDLEIRNVECQIREYRSRVAGLRKRLAELRA